MERIEELEQMAFNNLTGEQIMDELELINPKLREEYEKLMDGN